MGPYVEKLLSLSSSRSVVTENPYKISYELCDYEIDEVVAIEAFEARYSFDPALLESEIVESDFPSIMIDPHWIELARRDYG